MGLRIVFVAAILSCGFCVQGSAPALAQHVVTDVEAGKLTFDGLTATPRPIYRQIVDVRRMHRSGYATRPLHTHLAAYRRRAGFHSIRR